MQFGISESVAHWGRYRSRSEAVRTNGRTITYGELNRDIDGIVSLVAAETNPRVAVASETKYSLLIALIGVLRASKSVVVLNPGLSDDALRITLADADVSVLLHDHQPRIAGLVHERSGRTLDLRGVAQSQAVAVELRSARDEWGVIYSSGTTGTPKGIERDQESMVTEFVGWIIELGLHRTSRFFIGRPLYYTGGLVLAAATLIAGGTVIVDDMVDENDPLECWAALDMNLKGDRVDWAFFIPDQIRAVLKSELSGIGNNSRLENILLMGGPVAADEKIALARVAHCNVVESWGNSESLGTITEAEDLLLRPASVGRPFIGDELLIVDEQLNPLPPLERGRIAGGIEAGFLRYSNRPEATASARREGLIVSEDIGFQDADGYFYVLGRVSDSIVRAGETVFLSAIEARLRTRSDVSDCCVTSTGSEEHPEIVAIVRSPKTLDGRTFLDDANAGVSDPERVDQVVFHDIPRLPSGKIDRLASRRIAEDSS